MEERLQKILAHAGFGSRRACEDYITSRRVRVNGEIASLGQKADTEKDKITLDGKEVVVPKRRIYIALNKPRGVISAVSSPDPRPTVRDLIPVEGRIYPVGRLDIESEGLILMTDDGALANKLTHPRYGHEKVYKVLVATHPDQKQLDAWRRGIVLEDGYRTAPTKVFVESSKGKGTWLKVIMKEGRKRQIRETGSLLGLPVAKIIRVEVSGLHLGTLKPKEWRYLTEDEVKILKGEGGAIRPKPRPTMMRKRPAKTPGVGRKSPAKSSGAGRKPPAKSSGAERKSPAKSPDSGRKPPSKNPGTGRKSPAKNPGTRTRKPTLPKK